MTANPWSQQRRRLGRGPLASACAALAATLALTGAPGAVADDHGRDLPTREQVASAEQRVADTADQVGAIQASLLMANARLEAAAVEAAKAAEEYNGAQWRLKQAEAQVRVAASEAAAARRTVEDQRSVVASLVAASYRQADQLTAVTAMVGASGPEGVLDQYAAFHGASRSVKADYDRFAAAEAIAQVFEDRAREARVEQERLAARALAAKQRAAAAATQAQEAAAEIAAEKDRLIRRLARAQNISVSLAQRRQAALEEIARERAARRAQAEAEAAAQAAARERAREARALAEAQRAEERADAERRRARPDGAAPDSPASSTPPAAATPAERPRDNTPADTPRAGPEPESPPPAPAPPPPPTPTGSGGADRVIAFARAQVGEPYAWGSAGPDSWDCSGLMLRAWEQSGVDLPHYSVAQYYAGSPVSPGDLRPGDLVFWGTSDDPDSIFHVALYIGGGEIIHAPRTGRPVSVESMYYWTPPNFFARV